MPSAYEQWLQICDQQQPSQWEATDMAGNKAYVFACGYTLTGEDENGTSANVGTFYINILLYAQTSQSDRGTNLIGMLYDSYLAPDGTSCALNGSEAGCIALSGSQVYDLTDTGGVAPDSSPSVQPNAPGLFVISPVVPAAEAHQQLDLVFEGSNGEFTKNLGAGLESVPIFSSPGMNSTGSTGTGNNGFGSSPATTSAPIPNTFTMPNLVGLTDPQLLAEFLEIPVFYDDFNRTTSPSWLNDPNLPTDGGWGTLGCKEPSYPTIVINGTIVVTENNDTYPIPLPPDPTTNETVTSQSPSAGSSVSCSTTIELKAA